LAFTIQKPDKYVWFLNGLLLGCPVLVEIDHSNAGYRKFIVGSILILFTNNFGIKAYYHTLGHFKAFLKV
jgi:hypothetical protein